MAEGIVRPSKAHAQRGGTFPFLIAHDTHPELS
jgi:hypothetical protein